MNKQEKIDYVLKNFDFEKVHNEMISIGWNYGKDCHTPTLIEIKETAENNLNRLDLSEPSYAFCGGFLATHFNGEISLYFTTEWTSIE